MVKIRGGDQLEKRLKEIAANVKKASSVQVGFLENAKYPDGTPVALVAVVQDFGSPANNIPPRPFFRNMVAEKSKDWGDQTAAVLKGASFDSEVAMERMGMLIKGQLQTSITTFEGAPLKPATIAAKGFDKQLIDTGHMLHSVDYRVKKENG